MDLLTRKNIGKIVEEYANNPAPSYVPVYNALTKEYTTITKQATENFESFKSFWKQYDQIFEKGFNPYTPNQDNSGFIHVRSASYDHSKELKHRIYINPPVDKRLKFVSAFIRECQIEGVGFYFKFSRGKDRTDNFLIYAQDDQLEAYQRILEKMERERPELIAECGETPLSASRNGWWAYGPEEKSSQKGSLSSRTAKVIQRNITKAFIYNRSLFNEQDFDINALFTHARQLGIANKKVFELDSCKQLKQEFLDNKDKLGQMITTMGISPQQIEQDAPLLTITDNEGRSLDITPSVIAATLAHQKPNWTSYEQRDQFFDRLLYNCQQDLNDEGLIKPLTTTLNKETNRNTKNSLN